MKESTRPLPTLAGPGAVASHSLGPQEIPAEARVHTAVIVGNTGSGKSSAARAGFVEPILAAQRRCCIIDPTGIWWGLRFQADGSPGFPIAIVGGLYGDVPLHEYDAVSLADWIGQNDQPVIVDVSEMTIGERQEFGTEFFAQLYKANRRPLHLIIDEADEFAPQNPMPETKRLLHHVDRIVRRGRVRGFRPMMITQRPSVLHKNVMSQASALVAMRLLGSQDRDAVQLWIKGQGDLAAGKEVLNTLARLQVGEGWAWVPGLDILNRGRFPMFTTFDSSRTPKDDEPPVEPPGEFPWNVKFAELLEGVTGRDEEDEEEHDGLRTVVEPDPVRIAAAEKLGYEKGLTDGFAKGYDAASAALQGRVTGVLKAGEEFMQELKAIGQHLASNDGQSMTMIVRPTKESVDEWAARNVVPIQTAAAKRVKSAVTLSGAAEKLLAALATRGLKEQRKWSEVCVLAGIAYANGYFYGGRKYLLDQGLATEGGGLVLITEAGLKIAGGRQPPIERAQIIAQWSSKLRAPGGLMLQAIAAAKGLQLTKAQLAAALKIKPDNGYWYSGTKAMRDAGVVDQEGDVFRLTAIVREAP